MSHILSTKIVIGSLKSSLFYHPVQSDDNSPDSNRLSLLLPHVRSISIDHVFLSIMSRHPFEVNDNNSDPANHNLNDTEDQQSHLLLTMEQLRRRIAPRLLLQELRVNCSLQDAVLLLFRSNTFRHRFLNMNIESLSLIGKQEGARVFSLRSFAQLRPPRLLRKLFLCELVILPQEVLDLFTGLEVLDITGNKTITNVHFCSSTLRVLYANASMISDEGLCQATNLEELHVDHCPRVTTVDPFGRTLRVLHACEDGHLGIACGISDQGLQNAVHLRELNANGNKKISTVEPFAATLTDADVSFPCEMCDSGLSLGTELRILRLRTNLMVTTLAPFAERLRELYTTQSGTICDDVLAPCTNLVALAFEGSNVTTVKPFQSTLRWLQMSDSVMTDEGLSGATNIVAFSAEGCQQVTTVAPFARTLRVLDATRLCGIHNSGLAEAHWLHTLNARSNPKITSVVPFAKTLRVLIGGGNSGICDQGIQAATSLIDLSVPHNSKVTTVAPFGASLLQLTASSPVLLSEATIANAKNLIRIRSMNSGKPHMERCIPEELQQIVLEDGIQYC